MKIRSAVPKNGCLIFLVDGKENKKTKNRKKQKKTSVKHIHYRLIGSCVNYTDYTAYDEFYKKLSYCWETVRRESMPRIAEMDVEITT